MSQKTWNELIQWCKYVDERDLPDEARHFASDVWHIMSMPENYGEWKASLEIAFAAGMRFKQKKDEVERQTVLDELGFK